MELCEQDKAYLAKEADEQVDFVFKYQRTLEPGNDEILEQVPSNRDECINAIHSLALCANKMRHDRVQRLISGEEDLVPMMEKATVNDDGMLENVPVAHSDPCYLHTAVRVNQELELPYTRYTKILECAISPEAEDLFVYEHVLTAKAMLFLRRRALREHRYIQGLPDEDVCADEDTIVHIKRLLMNRDSAPFAIEEISTDESSYSSFYLPDNDTFEILEAKGLIHMPTNGNGYTVIGPAYWCSDRIRNAQSSALVLRNRIPKLLFHYDESQFNEDPEQKKRLMITDGKVGNQKPTIDLTPLIRPLTCTLDQFGEAEFNMIGEEDDEEERQAAEEAQEEERDDDDDDIPAVERMRLPDELLYMPTSSSAFSY